MHAEKAAVADRRFDVRSSRVSISRVEISWAVTRVFFLLSRFSFLASLRHPPFVILALRGEKSIPS